MAVAQPFWLMSFNETSGLTVTNYGTKTNPYIFTSSSPSPASPTDYTWNSGSAPAPYLGYFNGITVGTNKQPYAATAETTPGTGLANINAYVAFRISDVPGGLNETRFFSPTGAAQTGDVVIRAQNKSGSNFDLYVQFEHNGAAGSSTTFAGLTFGTDYALACSIDVATPGAVVMKASLNGAAAVTMASNSDSGTATANFTSFGWNNAWPYMFRRNDFAIYGGLKGRVYAAAYGRGQTVWSGTDLASITNDPNFITGWPGAPSGLRNPTIGPFGAPFLGKL